MGSHPVSLDAFTVPEDALASAVLLDRDGSWDEATALLLAVADRLPEQTAYCNNLIVEIEAKKAFVGELHQPVYPDRAEGMPYRYASHPDFAKQWSRVFGAGWVALFACMLIAAYCDILHSVAWLILAMCFLLVVSMWLHMLAVQCPACARWGRPTADHKRDTWLLVCPVCRVTWDLEVRCNDDS